MPSEMRGDGRRLLRAALALVCVVLVAAGCGVPGEREPETLGDAPGVAGPVAPAGPVELPQPTRDITPKDLVLEYLKIGAAADWDPALRLEDRIPAVLRLARRFLNETGVESWKPGNSINVVQVIETVPGLDRSVSVKLRQVGVLNGNGSLTPAVGDPQIAEYTFKVAPQGSSGPTLLSQVPDNLLPLSLEGLQTLFEVRPVYYWEPTERFLVPDRRYLSAGISKEKQVKTIVERVLAGPSEFLTQPTLAVVTPPVNKPLDNAVLNGNNVKVTLPVPDETDIEKTMLRLATQLRWSLHPQRYSVELQVGGRDGHTYSGADYLSANPSLSLNGSNETRLFGAVKGRVMPLEPGVPMPSILDQAANANVVAAAVNVKQNSAALVREVNGKRTLWVGRTPVNQAAMPLREASGLPGPVGAFSRPSYLPGAGDRVLVVAAGTLYDVDLGTGDAVAVSLPPPLAGSVVAVSVAPDGARIAMVTSSKVYVATIDPAKLPATVSNNSAQHLREIHVGNLTDLRGVGWNYENQIIVGGRSGLMLAAIDGGSLEPTGPAGLLGTQLTQLAAMPRNPMLNFGDVVIEVSASGTQQSYFPYTPDELRPVKAPAPSGGASPAPSASGSAAPPDPRVTAAFYADVI